MVVVNDPNVAITPKELIASRLGTASYNPPISIGVLDLTLLVSNKMSGL